MTLTTKIGGLMVVACLAGPAWAQSPPADAPAKPEHATGGGTGGGGFFFRGPFGGGWGLGWGGGYYSPGYSYYSPSYSYYSPGYSDYGTTYSTNYGPDSSLVQTRSAWRPVGDAPNPPEDNQGLIEIVNPPDSNASLSYNLNEFAYHIRPGQAQRVTDDRPWTIEFHRGGERQSLVYTLSAGRYKFVPTPDGWDLVRAADQTGMTTASTRPPEPRSETELATQPAPTRVQSVEPRRSSPLNDPIESAQEPSTVEQPR